MPSYSATDIGTRALRLLGVVDAVDTPAAEDIDTAFEALNDMVDDWGTQRQTIYYVTRSVFALTANTASYTLGSGGVWNIVRPAWIERVSVIPENSGSGNTGPTELPIGRPISVQQYQGITIKTATSTYPDRLYWDHDWVNGLSTCYVYPVPTSSNAAIVLYTPAALTEFADLSTIYSFPPGYARALRYNLAIELAPEFGIDPPETVQRIAVTSMADIKRANFAPIEAQFDVALVGRRGRYNIQTDGYG